jgi:hypothetical protein
VPDICALCPDEVLPLDLWRALPLSQVTTEAAMEMIVIDTLGAMQRHGYRVFGWCLECGSPSRYWDDVKARRAPQRAIFDIDLAALIRECGEHSPVVGLAPAHCPRCGSQKTETRITAPSKPRQ